jgi:hypothetical protein
MCHAVISGRSSQAASSLLTNHSRRVHRAAARIVIKTGTIKLQTAAEKRSPSSPCRAAGCDPDEPKPAHANATPVASRFGLLVGADELVVVMIGYPELASKSITALARTTAAPARLVMLMSRSVRAARHYAGVIARPSFSPIAFDSSCPLECQFS